MSLTTFCLGLLLTAAGAYGFRRWHHWLFVLAVAAGVVGSLVSVAQYQATGGVWWLAPWDFLLAPATVAVALLAFTNLAPILAQKLSPSWSSEGEFDRELYAALVELGAILDGSPQDPDSTESWIAQATTRASVVLHHLEQMNAPNSEWQGLLAGYVELTRKTAAAIRSGVSPDERSLLIAEGDALTKEYEATRQRHGKGWRPRVRPRAE